MKTAYTLLSYWVRIPPNTLTAVHCFIGRCKALSWPLIKEGVGPPGGASQGPADGAARAGDRPFALGSPDHGGPESSHEEKAGVPWRSLRWGKTHFLCPREKEADFCKRMPSKIIVFEIISS